MSDDSDGTETGNGNGNDNGDLSALDRVTVDYPNGHETAVVASAIS